MITLYSFENADGHEEGTFTTFNPAEAHEYAQRYGLKMIANDYEFSDSELVADYSSRRGNEEEE